MGKILSKVKTVGKNYYFYAFLYCVGILGMLILTIVRYEIIAFVLDFDNWIEVMYLLGTILSLPILALMFLQKVNKTLATMVAGFLSILIMIMFWISTTGAEIFVETLRDVLAPFLALFFVYSALTSMIHVWKKIR